MFVFSRNSSFFHVFIVFRKLDEYSDEALGSLEREFKVQKALDSGGLEEKRAKAIREEAEKKKNSGGISPGKLLGIAIFFFASAAGLWISGYWIEFTEEELFGVRAGILCCLILAVAATLAGMILSWKNGKRSLAEEQRKKEEKRKNAMVQTEE